MRFGTISREILIGAVALTWIGALPSVAQQYDQKLFSEMRWRCIGPFRGGRTVAISGVPHQPNVFYMAAVNGGVWKTADFGNTWSPIFDDQPTGSVGALALAPSDPNIIYVGSGEGLQRPDLATGDGIYKSTDAGKTWTHLQNLRDAQQITAILVDPKDPNRVFVAAEGHPYGPNAERGVFRSTDGGQSFAKVLYKDENTGAADLAFDPTNPQTTYAVLWAARVAPWEIRSGESFISAGSGIFKSADGGSKEKCRRVPFRRRGRNMETDKQRPPHRRTRPGSDGHRHRAGQSGSHLRRQHHDVEVHGRRENICGVQRSARRRRLPAHLDQHGKSADYRAQLRSGRGHQRERRRDVEQLVQSANGAVLSRHHRQSFSVLGLRRAAGKRLRCHAEPQRLWRNYISRLASHRHFRIRLRRRRPARSEHSLWRLAHAHETGYRRIRQSYAGGDSPRRVSLYAHAAGGFFAARTAYTLFRGQRAFQNDRCGKQLAGHQSRSHARFL